MKGKKKCGLKTYIRSNSFIHGKYLGVFVTVSHLTKTILTGSLVKLAFFSEIAD